MKTNRLILLLAGAACAAVTIHGQVTTKVLIDFGDTIGSTSSGLGNTWNSVIDSTPVLNLKDIDNVETTIDIFISSGGYGENGGSGGGGLSSPSQLLLGDLAVASATDDYFFTTGTQFLLFTLGGLDGSKSYSLELFGTRDTSSTRETLYTVTDLNGTSTATLQTSGTGAGSLGGTGNDDEISTFAGLIPNASNQITLRFESNNETFGYLGAMSITAVPEPATYALWAGALTLGLIVLRRRNRD
jgi:hypothetical protein